MTDFEKSSVFGKSVRPIAKFQRNDKLRRDIYAEIRKLNKTLDTKHRNSQCAPTVEKFLDSLIPSKDGPDFGRLPICASKSRAPSPNKVLCVFYLVSCLIQVYWAYLDDELEDDLIATEKGLGVLKYINKNYDNMKVVGNERLGYVLEL